MTFVKILDRSVFCMYFIFISVYVYHNVVLKCHEKCIFTDIFFGDQND